MKNTLNDSHSFMSLKDGEEFLVNGILKTVVSTGWGPGVGSCVKADDGKYYHDSMFREGLDIIFSADFQISRFYFKISRKIAMRAEPASRAGQGRPDWIRRWR